MSSEVWVCALKFSQVLGERGRGAAAHLDLDLKLQDPVNEVRPPVRRRTVAGGLLRVFSASTRSITERRSR